MKKALLLVLGLFYFISFSLAQNRQIKGKIVDESGTPIPGVNVSLGKTVVQTNANGEFEITAPATGTANLVLSFVGYQTQTFSAKDNDNERVTIRMRKSITDLEDLVVIGYQTIRRKNLLASVSSVSARDLKDMPIVSAEQLLNGRLAGVTATTAEGSPDADIRIRVRGGMSITGDNSPLYIVDGVQVENGLATVAPNDIQSIDVLKDAAATAIYGARGANGVIVITTKSGKTGKPKVGYNGFVGVRVLASKLDVLDPYDYVVYQSERSRGNITDSTSFTQNFGTTWDTLENYKNVDVVDWQEETFGRTGIVQMHHLALSGGSKKLTYTFGYTYNDEKAVVIRSDYKRHFLSLKAEYKITEFLRVGVSGRYTNQDVQGAGVSSERGSSYNRLRNAVRYRPFFSKGLDIDDLDPIADQSAGNNLGLINPILLAQAEYRKKSTDIYNATATLTYNITKNLTFRSTVGYNETKLIDRQFSDSLTSLSRIQGGANPVVGLDTSVRKNFTNSNVLTYSVQGFRNKHDFDILVGEETYDLRTETHSNLFRDYPNFTSHNTAFKETSLGVPFTGYPRFGKTRYTNLSFFGRVNYSFLDRYLFSFNIRADGASKFAPGRQWGYFPAASFAWRTKNEKFMENVNFISDLKFRFGYGSVGNNRIDDYLYLTKFSNDGSLFYGLDGQAILAYYPPALANVNLTWEKTINKNAGVDIELFNRRINLSVDVYHNTSRDLLLSVPIASTFGYSTQFQNVGKTRNKGVEVQLGAAIVRKTDFSWRADFNIAFNRNKVLQLGTNQNFFFTDAPWGVSGQPKDYIQQIGQPVGSMYGLVTDGFYTVDDFDYNPATQIYTLKPGTVTNHLIIGPVQPGSIKFMDLDGNDTIDINRDRTIIGDPTPAFTGGLNQQFTYKRWDMSIFVNFSVGNDIYNANKIEFTNGYINNANMLDIMKDRWKIVTPTGETAQWVSSTGVVYGIPKEDLRALNAGAKIWQPLKGSGAFYPHSWAIEDGSFLRLNNITIGYSFPVKSIARLKMSTLRFYFTANNLAVITGYSGYDPEVSVRGNPLTPGLDYSAYPKSRSFIFGVNASF
jgi:TonB-dependent starch-binding outer membrane protein SusC